MRFKTAIAVIVFWLLTGLTLAATAQDGKYLKKEIDYTLRTDGSWDRDYRHLMRYDTYYATRRMGETFITYNPRYQELKIEKSVTTMKDGKKIALPGNALNEVLPFSARKFPDHSHLREMVVTHTGLERGAMVDLHYRITTTGDFMPYFSAKEFISDRLPADSLTIKIAVPHSTPLKYRVFPSPVEPEIDETKSHKLYIFVFKDVEAWVEEPGSRHRDAPHILFSTAEDWASAFPRLKEEPGLPPPLVAEMQKIKAEASDTQEFYFKLQEMAADDIGKCHLDIDMTGFHLRSPLQVYESNYGTPPEKAFLVYRLLRHLDVPAEMVWEPTAKAFAEEIPSIYQAEQCFIKIGESSPGEGPVYLDPTEKQSHLLPYRLRGKRLYNLSKNTFETPGEVNWDSNGVHLSGKIEVGKGKCSGELSVLLEGYHVQYRSAVEDTQSFLSGTLSGILPVKKVEVKNIRLLTPRQLKADVRFEEALPGDETETQTDGDDPKIEKSRLLKEIHEGVWVLEKFKIPDLSVSMAYIKQRYNPLHLGAGFPCRVKIDLEFKFPGDYLLDFGVAPVSVENRLGFYKQEVKTGTPETGAVKIKFGLGIKDPVIAPRDYPDFRELLIPYFKSHPLLILREK